MTSRGIISCQGLTRGLISPGLGDSSRKSRVHPPSSLVSRTLENLGVRRQTAGGLFHCIPRVGDVGRTLLQPRKNGGPLREEKKKKKSMSHAYFLVIKKSGRRKIISRQDRLDGGFYPSTLEHSPYCLGCTFIVGSRRCPPHFPHPSPPSIPHDQPGRVGLGSTLYRPHST